MQPRPLPISRQIPVNDIQRAIENAVLEGSAWFRGMHSAGGAGPSRGVVQADQTG